MLRTTLSLLSIAATYGGACVSQAPTSLRAKDTAVASCTKWCKPELKDRQCGWCKCQSCPQCQGAAAAVPATSAPAELPVTSALAVLAPARELSKKKKRSKPAPQAAPAAAAAAPQLVKPTAGAPAQARPSAVRPSGTSPQPQPAPAASSK